MKILLLTAFLPLPPDTGSKIREFNLLRHLGRKHQISLISFIDQEDEKAHLKELEEFCISVKTVPLSRKSAAGRFGRQITGRMPDIYYYYRSAEMDGLIRDHLKSEKTDLVLAETIYMASHALAVEGLPRVLDCHDVEYMVHKRRLEAGSLSGPRRTFHKLQYQRLRAYEAEMHRSFDRTCVVSGHDGAIIKELCGVDAAVIPNGVDTSAFSIKSGAADNAGTVLGYCGRMESDTNIDAVNHFVSDIWPGIISAKSDVKFKVIGKNPPERLKEPARLDNRIEITGYVEDIPAEMSGLSMFVVPLRIGSGTRIKILEAMALGLPVVSTSIGAEGLDVRHGENILIADNPADFAGAVKRLMDDPELSARMGSAGRKLVMERYEWESIAERLDDELTMLVERKGI